jgi:hypothetical protein
MPEHFLVKVLRHQPYRTGMSRTLAKWKPHLGHLQGGLPASQVQPRCIRHASAHVGLLIHLAHLGLSGLSAQVGRVDFVSPLGTCMSDAFRMHLACSPQMAHIQAPSDTGRTSRWSPNAGVGLNAFPPAEVQRYGASGGRFGWFWKGFPGSPGSAPYFTKQQSWTDTSDAILAEVTS